MSTFEQTTLANLSIIKNLTTSLGGGIKKNFGQNFLINQNSLLKFISSINLSPEDTVIEIGPGIGVVSYSLCPIAKKVFLIEIDRDKEGALNKVLENYCNYEIIWADASTFDFSLLGSLPVKVIGSLPYNVGKRIIANLFTSNLNWTEAAFFLQREVAEAYTSEAPRAEFLSMYSRAYSEPTFVFGVPPEHFYPIPKVKTGVVHFERHDDIAEFDKQPLVQFIRQGFSQPRKTLFNNLKSSTCGIDPMKFRIKLQEYICLLGHSVTVRPSELDFGEWYELYARIFK